MTPTVRRAAFLFRRDLRLPDNTGLAAALAGAAEVLPCFVFDPRQTGPAGGPWFARNALQVHLEALDDLDGQLRERGERLLRFEGLPEDVVERLVREAGVEAVFVTADHTPFARQRDQRLRERCVALGVAFVAVADLLLHPPGAVLTGGRPYRVFTPYFRAAHALPVPTPAPLPDGPGRLVAPPLPFEAPADTAHRVLPERRSLHVAGGRAAALRALTRVTGLFDYAARRDLPAEDGHWSLSAHLKTGAVSAREAWHAVVAAHGRDHELVRQLHWRDFFTQLAAFHPHVFTGAFKPELDAVRWDDAPERLAAWAEGRTGFPIVDAGMRQLAQTGFMHNRVRMIAGSFLVKDLHLHWRLGEQHFARLLVDYDPCVNNGNWQWVASTGADAQPYFRIFNPWTQGARFDAECAYVRRFVPELADLPPAVIHRLGERRPPGLRYPRPVVDHRIEAREAAARFRSL